MVVDFAMKMIGGLRNFLHLSFQMGCSGFLFDQFSCKIRVSFEQYEVKNEYTKNYTKVEGSDDNLDTP